MPYLDNNATTRPIPEAIAAATEALETHWHNPSSVHRDGQAARHALELARADLASLAGVPPRQLTFTGSGTESIDLAIRGVLGASDRDTLITSRLEHAAVRDLAEHLASTGQARVRWIDILPGGLVDLDDLDSALREHPRALVSLQWANNETGVLQPARAIHDRCREAGAIYHCDAVQWMGKLPVGFQNRIDPSRDPAIDEPPTNPVQAASASERMPNPDPAASDRASHPIQAASASERMPRASVPPPADLLTLSPHKFHGPKGIGALVVRPGVRLRPTLQGTQELGRRGGTENVPGALAAGVAARAASEWLADDGARTAAAARRDRFERAVLDAIPDAVVNGHEHERLWNTTNIGFPRLEAEVLLLAMSERGLAASAGAACSSGSLDPSPVLLAMGVPPETAHGSVRFSLSRFTTDAEIDEAITIVTDTVRRFRDA